MKKIKLFIMTAMLLLPATSSLKAQWKSEYGDIPRVDVHMHISKPENTANYLKVRERLSNENGVDLTAWITLDSRNGPILSSSDMYKSSGGRMLCAFSDYQPHKGVHHTLKDFEEKKKEGFIGYKLWFGPWYRVLDEGEEGIKNVDNQAFDQVFEAARQTGTPMLSMHIADPNGPFGNRMNYIPDPVFFWHEVRAVEDVIRRHPDITIIVAHMVWLVGQDAQLDYLRFMLSTYPNLYVDLAATSQYFNLLNRDNLRDFMIEYSDRILLGTDSGVIGDNQIENAADRYARLFAILESNEMVHGSFFGKEDVQGLDLPREVLERIYYQNAMGLYPGLREVIAGKGY